MEKKLNIPLVEDQMLKLGLSQSELADKLKVTRSAVSAWLKPDSFPKPGHLLRLAELLELSYDQLVQKAKSSGPLVAFRRSGNFKVKPEHVEHFNYVARLLERLVPFLPEQLEAPPTLLKPSSSYDYVQKSTQPIREKVCDENGVVDFQKLIQFFKGLQAILIPVLWGEKYHKVGTHIYLPDSQTTWVFLNLDAKIFDFKFWVAHELAHAKAPELLDDEGENFADAFAGALLFPEAVAAKVYKEVARKSDIWTRADAIIGVAEKYVISPITVYKQLEAYAKATSAESLGLEKAIFQKTAIFNKKFPLLSEGIFKSKEPSAEQYLTFAKSNFGGQFFEALKGYMSATEPSAKFVANLLNIPLADAYSLIGNLCGDTSK